MKRAYRVIPAALAVLAALLVLAARMILPTAADGDVILTVSAYRINQPRESSMPFFRGGQLYVPTEIFSVLGLTCTEQSTTVLLSNMKTGSILYFDTANGTAADTAGVYQAAAVRKNGLWFVPAEFTAEHLGLTYSYHSVSPAPFVRITYPDDNLMSDESFLRYYRSTAPEMLAMLQPGGTTQAITTPSPPTNATSRPGVSSAPTATAPPTTPVPPANYTVYLVIDGLTDVEASLAALAEHSMTAVFRVQPADIARSGETLRAIAAAGHGFVLVGGANTTVGELNSANRELFAQTRSTTRMVVFDAEAAVLNGGALSRAGYVPLNAHSSVAADRSSLAETYDLLDDRGSAILLIPSKTAAAVLPALRNTLAREVPTYVPLTELYAAD